MTRIETESKYLNSPISQVWEFISILANHERIMPAQVINWKVDGDTCEYTIKGTGSVHLKVTERTEPTHLKLAPNGRIPFPFEVIWELRKSGEGTQVQAIMKAELSPVLKLVAVRPLTNFLSMQLEGLIDVFHGKSAEG